MRISDWSSDVCSSDLNADASRFMSPGSTAFAARWTNDTVALTKAPTFSSSVTTRNPSGIATLALTSAAHTTNLNADTGGNFFLSNTKDGRSEEHTSELQSLMRNSYAVF